MVPEGLVHRDGAPADGLWAEHDLGVVSPHQGPSQVELGHCWRSARHAPRPWRMDPVSADGTDSKRDFVAWSACTFPRFLKHLDSPSSNTMHGTTASDHSSWGASLQFFRHLPDLKSRLALEVNLGLAF